MNIININKNFMEANLDGFLFIINEYEGEYWIKENLMVDLNEKWKYSFCKIYNKEIVGFIICSKKFDFIHIHKFIVDKKYHNKGIGTDLLDALCQKCILKKIESIHLKVEKSNINAIKFYEKYGFIDIGSEVNLLIKAVKVKVVENILRNKVKAIDIISTPT